MRQWGRLGYPRRALRLHAAARIITEQHEGQVPASLDALTGLPGVGSYTAAAVASFAFGQRHAVLDTNVRRVLARLVRGAQFPPRSSSAAEARLAESLLPERPGSSPVVGRGDGTRRAGVHGSPAALLRLPGRAGLRLAAGREPGWHSKPGGTPL